jgi:uncharacterized caspase-like protein
MAVDDKGIVVGITNYPGITTLKGPEADAEDFYDWLTSPSFGDVPSARVEKIVTSRYATSPKPTEEVAQAFDDLHAEAFASGIPKRLGRRLYVYAAGHGAGLNFRDDPDQSDAALLVANATMVNAIHVMTKIRALYFLNAAIFDEIVVFMDCCRNPLFLNPNYPSYVNAVDINKLGKERRKFFAFATRWGLNSREKQFNGVTRGIFTTALTKGLRGAAATADGTITSKSLRDYLVNNMKSLMTDEELVDWDVQQPHIPDPEVDLVFATVPPQRVKVTVTFPANAGNQFIRMIDDRFQEVGSGQTVPGTAWEVPTELTKGVYLIEIPALQLKHILTLVGDERTINVDL